MEEKKQISISFVLFCCLFWGIVMGLFIVIPEFFYYSSKYNIATFNNYEWFLRNILKVSLINFVFIINYKYILKGFALTTILGVSVGVFITRPAFAAVVEIYSNN